MPPLELLRTILQVLLNWRFTFYNHVLEVSVLTLRTLATILGARRHLAKQPKPQRCMEIVTPQVAARSLQGCMI